MREELCAELSFQYPLENRHRRAWSMTSDLTLSLMACLQNSISELQERLVARRQKSKAWTRRGEMLPWV